MKQKTVDLINNFMEMLDHSYNYKTKNERDVIIEEIKNIVECEQKKVDKNDLQPVVSKRTLNINSCAALIKSMPTDQAIQIMKSHLTGQPKTAVIDGELLISYHNAR